jgi:hypothetical protein
VSEIPTAYVIEVFVEGYAPKPLRFGPEQYEAGYRLYQILCDALYESKQETVVWSVEY